MDGSEVLKFSGELRSLNELRNHIKSSLAQSDFPKFYKEKELIGKGNYSEVNTTLYLFIFI
jgi:hypothetical protein